MNSQTLQTELLWAIAWPSKHIRTHTASILLATKCMCGGCGENILLQTGLEDRRAQARPHTSVCWKRQAHKASTDQLLTSKREISVTTTTPDASRSLESCSQRAPQLRNTLLLQGQTSRSLQEKGAVYTSHSTTYLTFWLGLPPPCSAGSLNSNKDFLMLTLSHFTQ